VAAWEGEWQRTVAAANREGKLVLAGPPAPTYREALLEFQRRYPEIAVEYTGLSGRDFAPRVLAERRAEQYLWDVHVGGPESVNLELKPEGAFDPIKPALLLPEVLDDSQWLGGFDDGFMDRERTFTYGFQGDLTQHVQVNREAIPESELSTVEQLLDPRWRGKISWNDPTAAGSGSGLSGYWLMLKGDDWLRQLYEQDVVATRDLRQQVEWVVRNRYPIAIGADVAHLLEFQREGLGLNVRTLAPRSQLGSRLSPGFGNALLMNRAPNPNASKVFLNWLLTREAQAAWARLAERNSRRLDVTGPAESAPVPGAQDVVVNKEENQPYIFRAIDLAKTVVK
jgi:iron(III) transport system substrate-binding protein